MGSFARLALGAGAVALVIATVPQRALAVCSSAGTVVNANDCVPVGKGSQDCHLEWHISPQPPPDPKTGFPTGKITCVDNDPACDADTTPGQCTFLVAPCLNVVDGRFTCTPTDAATYLFKKPSDKDALKAHKDREAYGNRHRLNLQLDALVPTATPNVCGSQERFVVPLKKGGTVKGKGKIVVKMTDSLPKTDTDAIKFTCLPPTPVTLANQCASARHITSASELIGGPLGMGQVGDWLIENDKARFIIRDTGREFSFMLTYGGHLIDADLQRKLGPTSLSPPYPPGQDSYQAITPLINISSTDNPTSIAVINDGVGGGPAVLRTIGPDDLMDPLDPRVAIEQFSTSLGVPASAIDNNIPVTISTDYTLECGDDFVEVTTTINNTGGSALDLYVGDYANGSGQLEIVGPGLGFGEAALRLGDGNNTAVQHYDYLGWVGFGTAAGLSYGLIPQTTVLTSSFSSSGVVVPVYGEALVGVLLSQTTGHFHVNAGGSNSFKRWFAVGNNGMGRILDARTTLMGRGEITPALQTGFVTGKVTVAGQPIDGARVSIYRKPGDRGAQSGLVVTFDTRDGGFYQGSLPQSSTLPQGSGYYAAVKVPGHLYEGGGAAPLQKPINIGGATTVVDFDVPATGYVQVLTKDGTSTLPISAKVSVVGVQLTADPLIFESVQPLSAAPISGGLFGYDAREKVVVYGLPQVHFTDLGGDTGAFALQPGTYQIVVSHGPEWSVSKQMLIVVPGSPGSPQMVTGNVVPVVDTTGFISADFHVHMIESPDSVVSNRERIVTMLAEGVDYFVASDHDFITDLVPDVAALSATANVKTALSQEITYFDSGHFGAYPFDPANLPDATSHTGGALDWSDDPLFPAGVGLGYPSDGSYDLSPEDMAIVAKSPPFNAITVQANHFNSGTLGYFRIHGIDTTVVPPQSSTNPNQLRLDPSLTNTYTDELTALELWIENSRSQNALALGENLGDWFNLLNNFSSVALHDRLRKTATFDSDTHSTTVVQAGGPRNMIADTAPSIAAINPATVSNNLNDGRNIGTNGPFPRVTITGDLGAQAGHDLAKPLLVSAALGTATVTVDIQSPDWAEFDIVDLYVNTVPSCTTTSPNFVGGTKKLCTATPTFSIPVTPTPVVLGNGGTRLTATVNQILTGGTLPAGDFWVVAVVRGRDGISRPLFPMAPQSIFAKACSGDPCRSCVSTSADCSPFFAGTCTITNANATELGDGNLAQCGVTALAIANPLFVDRDGDTFYKGLTIP